MSASARSLVHLVGSFPGQTPQEVFALCGREARGISEARAGR